MTLEINNYNSHSSFNRKQKLTFQARLISTKKAKQALENNMQDLYQKCSYASRQKYFGNANFKEIYTGFKKAFEEATQDTPGTFILRMDKSNSNPLFAFKKGTQTYTDKDLNSFITPNDLLPVHNNKIPNYTKAAKKMSVKLALFLERIGYVEKYKPFVEYIEL